MGMDIRINLIPYLKIKKVLEVEVPKIERICPKHPKLKMSDNKFCPHCGSEIENHEYGVMEVVNPYSLLSKADLEDDLSTIEYLDGVLIAHQYPPDRFDIEEESSGEYNLLGIQQGRIANQVNWFKNYFAKHIEIFEKAYGVENVEVCWGLVHYWS